MKGNVSLRFTRRFKRSLQSVAVVVLQHPARYSFCLGVPPLIRWYTVMPWSEAVIEQFSLVDRITTEESDWYGSFNTPCSSSSLSRLAPSLRQSLLASAPSEFNSVFTRSPPRIGPSSRRSSRRIPTSSTTSRRRTDGLSIS